MWRVPNAVEEGLETSGTTLAAAMAREIAGPLLTGDRFGAFQLLRKPVESDGRILYAVVVAPEGVVTVHTFTGGVPVGLAELLAEASATVVFRTKEDSVLDVSVPVMDGTLGRLHVGLSRAEVVQERHRLLGLSSVAYAASLCIVLAVAQLVAARVARPLRSLQEFARRVPHGDAVMAMLSQDATPEVESLANSLREMADELERLEREREATQRRMIGAQRLAAFGEIVAGLAHEINNPLDGVLECVRYIEAAPDDRRRRAKYLPMVREGVTRIEGVMRKLLAFVRHPSPAPAEPFFVTDVVRDTADLLEGSLAMRGVTLRVSLNGNYECVGDRQAAAQAFLNLLLNAADAAGGRPEARIHVQCDCDDDWVRVCVDDSGPGVTGEARDRIFDPFYTTKESGSGTGLGLTVSRQLMRGAGGEVRLEEAPSSLGGARFTLLLPKGGRRADDLEVSSKE